MTLDALIENLPSYANDLKLNFSSIVSQQMDLTEQQVWGTVVAGAIASRCEQLIGAVLEAGANHLSPQALEAAKASAAIMGMNNIYYRFVYATPNDKYRAIRSGLRMNVMRTHASDPLDFELWSLAVSAINGCGHCVEAHERMLREKGVTEEKILAAIRVASVVHAIAVVVDAERVASPAPVGARVCENSVRDAPTSR
jgi:lipoyl-dependent peroxiredoxin subunit D